MLRTPVNFIVHSLHEVNDGLAHGRVFFMEVAKDGIALYESDGSELATPRPKAPGQALKTAREYFEEYVPSAMQFLRSEEHTSELQSLMRISYAVFLLTKKKALHTLMKQK